MVSDSKPELARPRLRRWHWLTISTVGVVAAVASCPAVALASPREPNSNWDPTDIVAFSDTSFGPDATDYAPYDLGQLALAYCTGKGDRVKVRSLGAALKIADRLVQADTRGKGLAAFAKTKYGHSESKAIAVAAGELRDGKPAIALAAFLRAHQLAPQDAAPLIDAAPLLTQAGKAQAALEMLTAASHLKLPTAKPFGVSFTALLENNEGQALLGTHQFGAAEKMLTKAASAGPLLRESRELLAAAYMCTKQKGKAGKFLIAGTFRQQGDIVRSRDKNPAEVLDTAHGKQLELPVYSYPASMELGASEFQAQLWQNVDTSLNNDLAASEQKYSKDATTLSAAEAHWNPLTKARTNQILADIRDATDIVPELTALAAKAEQVEGDISDLENRGIGEGGCLDPNLHGQWLSDVQAYDTEERDAAEASYKMQTAFASNLRNPLSHRVGVEIAQAQAAIADFLIANQGLSLANYDVICYQGPASTPPDSVSSGEPSTPASAACPTSIPHVTVNFVVAEVSVNCESVSAEGSGEIIFVNGEHNFKTGQNTVFVGAKGELGIASAHVGFYVTVDASGHPVDLGVRATSEIGLGGDGPISIGADAASIQIGVAGGLSVTLPGDPAPE